MFGMDEAVRLFEEKINKLLEKRDYLKSDDWQDLCFVMFLHYESEMKFRELLKKT